LQAKGIRWVSCDFFKQVPAGADLYIMKHILHDWNDTDSSKILRNIRSAIPANGKLVCFESVVPARAIHAGPESAAIPLIDMNMLVVCEGGRERTETEWRSLVGSCGFKLNNIIPCPPSVLSIIELIPISASS